jgi:hypothetical protein
MTDYPKNCADYDWHERSIVTVPEQAAIAVYSEDADEIVIRQKASPVEETDSIVIIQRHNLPILIETLKSFVG